MVIGITGNSGSGKTEIAKKLAKRLDASLINADEIVREMSKPGQIYYQKILEIFGKEITIENGLNKRKIAEIIYNDSEKREELNNLTYKYIVDEIKAQVEREKATQNIVLDAPLLFESGLDKICEHTIAIFAEEKIKIKRICKRDNISEDTAIARLNIQKDNQYYVDRAEISIQNNGKIEEIDLEDICIKIGMN